MKKKSFTRALAGISTAVLLAVSLTPQTIPAMAAENRVQTAESDQAEAEKTDTSAEINQEAESSKEGSASADAAAEAGKSADSAQQTGENQSASDAGTASSDD